MSDPTDPGGVTAAQAERTSGRQTRVGDNGSPVGSPLTIILAVVAVVVGFLIFRTIDSGGSSAGGVDPTDITTPPETDAQGNTVAPPPGGATTAAPPTTVAATRDGATVVVVNAAGVSGVAAAMTEDLAGLEYTMEGEGITSNGEDLTTTVVYYNAGTGNPATLAVAQTLASDLGVAAPQEAPDPLPTDDSTGAATVFVMLGSDLAGQDPPGAATATTTPTVNTPAPTTTTGE